MFLLLFALLSTVLGDCPVSDGDALSSLQVIPRRPKERRLDSSIVIPGLGSGGNPTPKMNTTEVIFDNETLSCSDEKWQYGEGYLWTFSQIAEAFMTYGANKFYEPNTGPDNLTQCVAALVIASGECSPIMGSGCNASATGPSGVFQLDFLRSSNTGTGNIINPQIAKDGNIMNLCISGFGAGFVTGAPWYDESKEEVVFLEGDSFATCMGAPDYVNNYSCPDPNSVAGTTYSNYVGTFCHKSYATSYSPCNIDQTTDRCCGMWNGGANSYQDPFPDYYLEKANDQLALGVDFKGICEAVLESMQ
ncbi:Uncharacterized protein SCF082_LOCUS52080 [Durusdinium trenchii]|uniref:Uncharacterized protein n=1 Tax=Durusdinium trenchii TaxID=1381693 RepID=A0ABP0I3T2_9DINO